MRCNIDIHSLKMGDVIEWAWEDGYGTAVAGGQGIVLEDCQQLVEKSAYEIRVLNIAVLLAGVDRAKVVANIFKDRDFKLQVDKRMVMKDGKPVMDGCTVRYE